MILSLESVYYLSPNVILLTVQCLSSFTNIIKVNLICNFCCLCSIDSPCVTYGLEYFAFFEL